MKLLEDEDIPHLSMLSQVKFTEWGKILFYIIKRAHDKADRSCKKNPRIDNVIKEDVRYKLGYVEALYDVMNLSGEATKYNFKGG